ncbi:hypothetical protein FIBSPDRAFT_755674, partial [Athelia psychrophila]
IIDGRYHNPCRHFTSMATQFQDCLSEQCLFSSRHIHPIGCKSQSCARLMAQPNYIPIRTSTTQCPDCVSRLRDGILGLSDLST